MISSKKAHSCLTKKINTIPKVLTFKADTLKQLVQQDIFTLTKSLVVDYHCSLDSYYQNLKRNLIFPIIFSVLHDPSWIMTANPKGFAQFTNSSHLPLWVSRTHKVYLGAVYTMYISYTRFLPSSLCKCC